VCEVVEGLEKRERPEEDQLVFSISRAACASKLGTFRGIENEDDMLMRCLRDGHTSKREISQLEVQLLCESRIPFVFRLRRGEGNAPWSKRPPCLISYTIMPLDSCSEIDYERMYAML
jgi:hypothetical protein